METRNANIIINSSGGTASRNGKTHRVTIPNAWINQLGISPNDRSVILTFNGKKITISKS